MHSQALKIITTIYKLKKACKIKSKINTTQQQYIKHAFLKIFTFKCFILNHFRLIEIYIALGTILLHFITAISKCTQKHFD